MTTTTAADVIAWESAGERTYSVPRTVAAVVAGAYPGRELSGQDAEISTKLVTLGRVTTAEAARVRDRLVPLLASGDPAAQLFGGADGLEWSEKIVAGVARDAERDLADRLGRIDYDGDAFLYVGLTAPGRDRVVEHLLRVPSGDAGFRRAEALTAAGEWAPVPGDSDLVGRSGLAVDRDAVAFVASAIVSGHDAVIMHEAVPVCFLEEMPLLASVAPGDRDDSDAGAHYYAIVDPTDTTAVMSVIKIEPGPQVLVRNGGDWAPDQATLDSLMSVTPPPLVELTGSTLESVVQQTDAAQAQQVAPDGSGGAGAGANLDDKPIEQKAPPSPGGGTPAPSRAQKSQPRPGEPAWNSSAMTSSGQLARAYAAGLAAAQTARARAHATAHRRWETREAYESGWSLTAALESADALAESRSLEIRRTSMLSALSLLASLRQAEGVMERFLLPAALLAEEQRFVTGRQPLVADASQSAGNRAKGHLEGTERLKVYWTTNPKATAEIMWGVPGDFNRCRAKVGKYLPPEEVNGYCANLHKRATGAWPGHAPAELADKAAKAGH